MGETTVAVGPLLLVVLGLLTLIAAAVVSLGRLGRGRPIVSAVLRAAVQLGGVSLLIAVVLGSWWLTVLFALVMATVAAATAAERVSGFRALPWTGLVIVASAGTVSGMLLGSGVVPLVPVAVVPIVGILIGGSMRACSLAGRRALDELRARHGEYEAALALGLLRRDAALEICRPSAVEALMPGLDQTRTVGLVTLPGAYVGMLLGGASPIQAGVTQLLVLVGMIAVDAIAVLATVQLVARGPLRARPRRPAAWWRRYLITSRSRP